LSLARDLNRMRNYLNRNGVTNYYYKSHAGRFADLPRLVHYYSVRFIENFKSGLVSWTAAVDIEKIKKNRAKKIYIYFFKLNALYYYIYLKEYYIISYLSYLLHINLYLFFLIIYIYIYIYFR
jgi:hypothetical protein